MTKANNGVFEPEMRLPACIFFACFIPISFFWYGWSIEGDVHVSNSISFLFPFNHPARSNPLTPLTVDRPHNRPHPLRLRYDGYLHPNSDIRHRFLSLVCSIGYCSSYNLSQSFWCFLAIGWAQNVSGVGIWLGK